MSKEALRDFIENYVSISDDNWEEISSYFLEKKYNKGDLLLEEGLVCNHLWFLEEGLLRFFIWKDGEDISKFFTIPPYLLTSQRSLATRKPAKESIEALKDCTTWKITYEDNEKLLKKEVWSTFARKLVQEVQHFTEEILEDLQNDTAEKRYKRLLESNSELVRRVPLKYLSSFLGITPQSLSRIRRRI